MNAHPTRQAKDSVTLTNFARHIRNACSNFVFKLNSRINAKSLPSHHRMGSWQHRVK
jgi:hypothetical protein